MTHDQIIKFLREPGSTTTADFVHMDRSNMSYRARLKGDFGEWTAYFMIPIEDIGSTKFFSTMPAKNLIRWLIDPNQPLVTDQ